MAKKSWAEKFANPCKTEVKTAPKDFADIKAGQTMALVVPRDVDAVIRTLKSGEETDTRGLRKKLARKFKAETACPVVTGICLRIVAEHVGEQLEAGVPAAKVTPVWRAMPEGAPLWKKLENGKSKFKALRKAEGLA